MKQKTSVLKVAAWAVTLCLTACATGTNGDGGDVGDAGKAAAPAAVDQNPDPKPPKVVNLTPFENLTLSGVDQFGEYTSLALKITYAILPDGTLHAFTQDQEVFINENTPHTDDYACRPHGGGFNQRTTWFPDTGLFVQGGRLTALHTSAGKPRPLLQLTEGDRGIMGLTGPQARASEYVYVPCVGDKRVRAGARTVGYVMPGDRLQLRPSARGAKPFTLVMPAYPRPYAVLDFAGRTARAVVPAHIVLLTLDLPRRRVVAQYQITVAMTPQVAQARWLAVVPPETMADRPAGRELNEAAARYIEKCDPPNKPMDPCANPHGNLPAPLKR